MRAQKTLQLSVARLRCIIDNLQTSPAIPDTLAYATLVKECRDTKALAEGRRLHKHIVTHGFHRTTFLGNFLIQMYGRCGSPFEAQAAFQTLISPNSFSWNLLLSAYAQNGHLQEAETVLRSMPDPGTVSRNIMITAYAEAGDVQSARGLFDSIQGRDTVTWNSMIAAYAKNEQGEAGLALFREMDLEGVLPSNVTFVSLLDSCSSIRSMSVRQVSLLHSLLEPLGHTSNVVVATALLNLYGRCGGLTEAKHVFDSMSNPNVVTWTTMVILYLHNGDLPSGTELFFLMPERSIVSWNAMITASSQKGRQQQAEEFYARMPNRDIVSLNSMLSAYASAGHVQPMRSLFESLPERNLISWNTMITGYAQAGQLDEALWFFKTMQLEGVSLNKVTFVAVLDACAVSVSLAEGRMIHRIVSEFVCLDVPVRNVLIKLYAACGDFDEARKIFEGMSHPDVCSSTAMITAYGKLGLMKEARTVFDCMPEQDVVAWTAIVDAYAQNGHLEESEKLFERMPVKDQMAWNTMVVGYGQNNRLEDAKRVFDGMPRRNTVTWNALIAAYVQHGEYKPALKMFRLMDLDGEQPSKITFLTVLDACALNGSVGDGRVVHSVLLETGMLSENSELGTTLVNMYGRCGSVKHARRAFEDMPRTTYISWNSLITANAQNGHGEEAMELTRLMELDGYVSNQVTFLSNLFACSHAGLLKDGRKLFLSMQGDYGLVPQMDHYCCMVDLLGRSGTMEDANDLIESMPYEPNTIGWKALLGASRMHYAEQGVAGSTSYIQTEKVEDSSLYVLLSNLYTN